MDIRKIKKLIELLEESGIEELEICEGEESVRISRGGNKVAAAPAQYYAAPQAAPAAPAAAPAPTAEAAAPAAETPSGHLVRSPMVGTFYRSPAPGARGARVESREGAARERLDVGERRSAGAGGHDAGPAGNAGAER